MTADPAMTTLAHTRVGHGEPLLLVHGITHRRQGWDRVLEPLSRHHEVIAVDLPGHGDSPDLPSAYDGSARTLTGMLEEFLAGIGVERPHVAGNSLGGLIALDMAARGSARSATAISPAGFWSPAERVYARTLLGGASALLSRLGPSLIERLLRRATGRALLAGFVVAHPSHLGASEIAGDLTGLTTPRASFRVMLDALESWTLPDAAEVPTTIGWGSRDLLLPRRQLARVHETLPDAQVYLLPGCGHVPMGDAPDLVVDLILAGTGNTAPMAHENEWYYCLKHHRVEGWDGCRSADRLGPYPDQETASRALEIARERTEAEDRKDAER